MVFGNLDLDSKTVGYNRYWRVIIYVLDKEMGFENTVALLVWVVVACLGIWYCRVGTVGLVMQG